MVETASLSQYEEYIRRSQEQHFDRLINPPVIQRKTRLYLIGSLRNPGIPSVAQNLRDAGYDVFDDWHAAGPLADDEWKRYEQDRGRSYKEALDGEAARHVFGFDKHHLDRSDGCVLVLPAGKSGHLELGYMVGRGKPCYILLDSEDVRWDVMYQFVGNKNVVDSVEGLIAQIKETQSESTNEFQRVLPYIDGSGGFSRSYA